MDTKSFQGRLKLKEDGDLGEFEVVFATLNVIDQDGDVTLPGAFTDGEKVRIAAWGHAWGDLPVGRGEIYEVGDEAVCRGKFFLDTQAGKEHYQTVKNLGELQEWSYGFDILGSEPGKFEGEDVRFLKEMKVIEVSPVMLGAGINTRTNSIKGVKKALPSHSTATSDGSWDGPANEKRVKVDQEQSYYKRVYAWADPDGEAGKKSTYKFIHHEVGSDGTPGAANIQACRTGIGALNGARGGTVIPDADRRGVYNHLAKHLRDGDVEPPELKALVDAVDAVDMVDLKRQARELAAKVLEMCDQLGDGDGEGEGSGQGEAGDGKSRSPEASTLAARVAMELLEME